MTFVKAEMGWPVVAHNDAVRYMGEATARGATSADQEFYPSVEAYCAAHDLGPWMRSPDFDPDNIQRQIDHAHSEVTAVLESAISWVDGEKIRGATPEDFEQGEAWPVAYDDNENNYWLVGSQIWLVTPHEKVMDSDELDLLLRAAARGRQLEHERRVANAKRVLGEHAGSEHVRRAIPNDVKMFVWQRDGGTCVNCGTNADLEFDHIIPLSMGGADTARNLQLLCGSCNRAKGGRLV